MEYFYCKVLVHLLTEYKVWVLLLPLMVSCGCSVSNSVVLPPGALTAVYSYRWRCSEPWKLSELCWEADWVLPRCSFRKVFPGYFRSAVQDLTAVLTLARSWMLFFRRANWKQTCSCYFCVFRASPEVQTHAGVHLSETPWFNSALLL